MFEKDFGHILVRTYIQREIIEDLGPSPAENVTGWNIPFEKRQR